MATTEGLADLFDLVRQAQLPPPRERRRIRERPGVPRHVIAEKLGVSVMTLYRWEHDTNPRSLEMAALYREILDGLEEITS